MGKKLRITHRLLKKLCKIANKAKAGLWLGPSYPVTYGNWTGGDIVRASDMETVAVTANHADARHIAVNSPAMTLALSDEILRLRRLVAHLRRERKCRQR